jgi:hypothetical protein
MARFRGFTVRVDKDGKAFTASPSLRDGIVTVWIENSSENGPPPDWITRTRASEWRFSWPCSGDTDQGGGRRGASCSAGFGREAASVGGGAPGSDRFTALRSHFGVVAGAPEIHRIVQPSR